jgi:succinate-semialdehyde dehydrogenase / glutarate-semialdehyde dehydrogenase
VPGDPMDPATTLAPLSTEGALVKLLEQVEQAIEAGATLITGGQRIDRPGAYMQPTILTNIKPGNPAFREEFFGPVALMFRVNDEDEAIALANDSDYGLGGSIFTQDVPRGQRLASRIDTGMVLSTIRNQKLRLRPRAFPAGHRGVCEQKAGAHAIH